MRCSWRGLPAELYPHGAETLDFTGFPRYLLLRCEDEIAGCFAGDLLSQVSYIPKQFLLLFASMLRGLFYCDGRPGQFAVTLRMMISDILASPFRKIRIKSTHRYSLPFPLRTVLPNPHDFRICEGKRKHIQLFLFTFLSALYTVWFSDFPYSNSPIDLATLSTMPEYSSLTSSGDLITTLPPNPNIQL